MSKRKLNMADLFERSDDNSFVEGDIGISSGANGTSKRRKLDFESKTNGSTPTARNLFQQFTLSDLDLSAISASTSSPSKISSKTLISVQIEEINWSLKPKISVQRTYWPEVALPEHPLVEEAAYFKPFVDQHQEVASLEEWSLLFNIWWNEQKQEKGISIMPADSVLYIADKSDYAVDICIEEGGNGQPVMVDRFGKPITHAKTMMVVLSPEGQLYAAGVQKSKKDVHNPKIRHSSFLSAGDGLFAGTIFLEGGVFKIFNNKSGHYRPGENAVAIFIEYLANKGVNLNTVLFEQCDFSLDVTDIDDAMKTAITAQQFMDMRIPSIDPSGT